MIVVNATRTCSILNFYRACTKRRELRRFGFFTFTHKDVIWKFRNPRSSVESVIINFSIDSYELNKYEKKKKICCEVANCENCDRVK